MPSILPSAPELFKAVITTLLVGLVIGGLGALTGVLDASVPLWLSALALLLAPVAFVLGRFSRAGESLEPFYVFHIQEVLDTLQKVIAGEVPGVSVSDFIERGILAPARQWLAEGDEDIRISILVPRGGKFSMELEAGHSVEARQRFQLDVHGSFAGFALASGEMEWTNDVETDTRWRPHPKARPGREYGSLASVPIRVGDTSVAVLNVLSTEQHAFQPSELMYIDTLGSIINVVWSLAAAEEGSQEPPKRDDQTSS